MHVSVLSWHRRVWRLAGPIMFSSVSVPLLGAVDTAVVGHLPGAEYIGAVAVGTTIFNILFLSLGFLRMGTTGLTAQAVGAGDGDEMRAALARPFGLALAIATTTSPVNIAALLRKAIGAHWRSLFGVVEDASTAPRKKPHPQVYLQTLQRMGMSADHCLAIEDSANGLQAALAAGLPTVITPNGFTAHHRFEGALRVVPDLGNTTVADLRIWHSQARAA